MTNREIAENVLRERGLCGCKTCINAIESALDAAERRGKIEALEWALPIFGQSRHAKRLRDELARLRAEEGK